MMSKFPEHFTLVMVEDDPGHATLIQKNLKRAGIHNPIVHLCDGAAAIDYFFGTKNTPPQPSRTLLLLDLNLPEVDGYEVLRRMKEESNTANIPIIVLTTADNAREVNRCYELGCNVYMSKPVDYDQFTHAIDRLASMLTVVQLPHSYR